MKPFFLRRLKSEVLTALPAKNEEVLKVPMTQAQHETYFRLVQTYKQRAKDVSTTFVEKIVQHILSVKNYSHNFDKNFAKSTFLL